MKIVIDFRESGTSTGRYIDKIVENLQLIDAKNTYILLTKKHRMESAGVTAKNFHLVECNVKEFTLSEQLKLLTQVRKLKPDVVHFPMVQQPLLYRGRVATTIQDLTTLRFTNPTKNPVIFKFKQFVYYWVNYIVVRKSKTLLTISDFVRQDCVKTLRFKHPEKFTITYNSADALPTPAVPVKQLESSSFIMYVGRHLPHKNLDRLVSAHQALLIAHPNLKLVIVGKVDGASKVLQDRISRESLKNIVFTGFVDDNQLRWLYENTACYVFPSLSEGFGLPGLEAMKHGAPVASSQATCLPEVYGDAVHYFSPYSTQEMAEKIDDILTHGKLRNELIKKGRKQAEKYSWRRSAELTLASYMRIAEEKR
jgi:glycosyltransferase involved in cell wall biosynthesis